MSLNEALVFLQAIMVTTRSRVQLKEVWVLLDDLRVSVSEVWDSFGDLWNPFGECRDSFGEVCHSFSDLWNPFGDCWDSFDEVCHPFDASGNNRLFSLGRALTHEHPDAVGFVAVEEDVWLHNWFFWI